MSGSRSFLFLICLAKLFLLTSIVKSEEIINNNAAKTESNGLEVALPTAAAVWAPAKSGGSKNDGADVMGSCSYDDEYSCLLASVAEFERPALEALRALHRQLDDDANGNIDLSESEEFLREELHYEDGSDRRQKNFHRNDDTHISVRELWESWIKSEVHNWTVEQTVDWLVNSIDLPQYAQLFLQNGINGTKLPRMATTNTTYFSKIGIKDGIHRQKIALKAMDVVLFGPPREVSYSYTKDVVLVVLLLIAIAGCWYAHNSKRNSQRHLSKLMRDLESLSSAEKELQELQVKLQLAQKEQNLAVLEKEQLEKQFEEEAKRDSDSGVIIVDSELEKELNRLRNEVEVLRSELQRAEGELVDRCWLPPAELQHWLQLTYELEQRAYNKKKQQAETQLEQAKEACDRLRKKRSSFVGAFVSTHGRAIDDVDRSILEARNALLEVKQDLQERTTRWKQIEMLSGVQVVSNPGLAYLETLLRTGAASKFLVLPRTGLSFDEDDESSSILSSSAAVATAAYGPAPQPQQQEAAALPRTTSSRFSGPYTTSHQLKYFMSQDSNASLESYSTSSSSGNNGSSHSISDRPRSSSNVSRGSRTVCPPPPLSKESVVEPLVVSGAEGDGSVTQKNGSVTEPLITSSTVGKTAVPEANEQGKSGAASTVRSTGSVKSGVIANPDIVQSIEPMKKSPSISSRLGLRAKVSAPKSYSQDAESISQQKPLLRKVSHSESDLKSSFQVEAESSSVSSVNSQSEINAQTDSAAATIGKHRRKIFSFASFARRKKKTPQN